MDKYALGVIIYMYTSVGTHTYLAWTHALTAVGLDCDIHMYSVCVDRINVEC